MHHIEFLYAQRRVTICSDFVVLSGRQWKSEEPPERAAPPSKRLGMSNLKLQLRQGETLIINGASIRFRSKACIELTAHARFLFGKQIMLPEAADTPARRLYLALQAAYIGSDQERAQGLEHARALTAALKEAAASALARDILGRALAAAEADDCYTALKLARQIVCLEDVMLGRASANPQPHNLAD